MLLAIHFQFRVEGITFLSLYLGLCCTEYHSVNRSRTPELLQSAASRIDLWMPPALSPEAAADGHCSSLSHSLSQFNQDKIHLRAKSQPVLVRAVFFTTPSWTSLHQQPPTMTADGDESTSPQPSAGHSLLYLALSSSQQSCEVTGKGRII